MGGEQRYPRAEAQSVAEELVRLLTGACEKIEIAGSLRRGRDDVGDIELLVIPKPSDNLFRTDALDDEVLRLMVDEVLTHRLNAKGNRTYGPKNKLLVHVPSGIPVDVFSTDAEHWGMAMVIRTGPKELNIRMMNRLQGIGFSGYIYGIKNRQGEDMPVREESDVFRLLDWPYEEPRMRH